ncbi:hypothetical protein E1B28_008435 [Marasmius oreades]|uniref:MYND-type domain-containing protein n=1 Tax=Marasmius oreades TaxID=181124 RepID=A0A9P7RYI5_9AGAR|nr:uncharacterized protein E1B28_008435 [Marasmius oreades]KAG7092054.1 hypothetical protein E1B28_008435 [Marasmius oreades]
MRESNFSFPTQNKACVCITSQLYDRRALDTTSPLPLFNSLTHLAYLTSTSPRIREIMTMDGGLERLVRLLHDFCLSPPPPENPSLFYGLAPPTARPLKPAPQLNPPTWDKHATYRFSLAFQCVVNIGVRGSEPIRSRVVQAGTLEVVGCILEAWLDSRGFGGAAPVGTVRETREQRHARRMQKQQQDEAVELARALQRQMSHTESTSITSETTTITRDRSGTVVARSVWENTSSNSHNRHNRNETATYASSSVSINTHSALPSPSLSTGSNSRPDTSDDDGYSSHDIAEADGDMDGDIDMSSASASANASDNDGPSASPSPERRPRRATHTHRPSRIVSIVADPPAPNINGGDNAHIVVSDDMTMGMDGVAVGVGVGSVGEDGMVSLDANDDLAMGAPPGAPGAITSNPDISLGLDEGSYSASETEREDSTSSAIQASPTPSIRPITLSERSRSEEAITTDGMLSPPRPGEVPPDVTPRAGVVGLPTPIMNASSSSTVIPEHTNSSNAISRSGTLRGRPMDDLLDRQPSSSRRGRGDTIVPNPTTLFTDLNRAAVANEIIRPPAPAPPFSGRPSSSHHHISHTHPISPYRDEDVLLGLQLLAYLSKYPHVRQAFYKKRDCFHPAAVVPVLAGRGKGKEKDPNSAPETRPSKQTNVFSLVERFTFRSSSASMSGDGISNGVKLPPEIQYWAGVIMRNACRKDDSRGGIRQCANMLCGRWESYPREFAKCRRCRKAKYCGKECQSTAWSEGHRFWCSAKDGGGDVDDAATVNGSTGRGGITTEAATQSGVRGDSVAGTVHLTSRDVTATVRRGRDRPDPINQTQAPPHGILSMLARSRGTNPHNTVNAPGNPILLNRPVQQVRADPAMYAEYLRTAFGVGGSRGEGSEVGSPGRRRAETVTGATSTSRRDLVIPPYVPNQGQVNHRMQGRRAAEPSNADLDERTRNEAASAFQRFLSAEGRRREAADNDMEIE